MNILYGQEKIILPNNIINMLRDCIPNITEDKLVYLYKKVRFIVSFQNLKFLLDNYELDEIDDMNFIVTRHFSVDGIISDTSLTKIKDFLCLSRTKSGSIFNPNMKDIFSQIPYDVIDEIDAFEILEYPQTLKDEKDEIKYDEVAQKNYCLMRVRAYKRK